VANGGVRQLVEQRLGKHIERVLPRYFVVHPICGADQAAGLVVEHRSPPGTQP
jgi:hypothetical protein